MAHSKPDPSQIAKGKCPICGEPTDYEQRPFCSRRCANIDLYRWLSNGYAIPGRAEVDEDGDDGTASPAARGDGRPGADDGSHKDEE